MYVHKVTHGVRCTQITGSSVFDGETYWTGIAKMMRNNIWRATPRKFCQSSITVIVSTRFLTNWLLFSTNTCRAKLRLRRLDIKTCLRVLRDSESRTSVEGVRTKSLFWSKLFFKIISVKDRFPLSNFGKDTNIIYDIFKPVELSESWLSRIFGSNARIKTRRVGELWAFYWKRCLCTV